MSADINDSPYQVQVLDRALGILDVLSSDSPELSPIELSQRLDLHKSTVHRLLMVLERHRLIEKSQQNGKYRLGLKLFELGSKVVSQLNLSECAQTYLARLVHETGETAHLCIMDGGEMVSLTNLESSRTVRTPATVGRRTPIHCTAVGKAMLAFLPESEVNELIKKRGLVGCTPNTITTLDGLRAELQIVRNQGYAVDNEEIEEELKCIGAPIRNYSGQVIASISIAGPAYRLPDHNTPTLGRFVVAAADDLSLELGYLITPSSEAAIG